jgi:hypothetical protein
MIMGCVDVKKDLKEGNVREEYVMRNVWMEGSVLRRKNVNEKRVFLE